MHVNVAQMNVLFEGYVTPGSERSIARISTMPVVVLCHSLGCGTSNGFGLIVKESSCSFTR